MVELIVTMKIIHIQETIIWSITFSFLFLNNELYSDWDL